MRISDGRNCEKIKQLALSVVREYNKTETAGRIQKKVKGIKKLLINTVGGGAGWTGGLYYARNIAFELLQNAYIREHYRIYISCSRKNRKVFEDLEGQVKLITSPVSGVITGYMFREYVCLTRRIRYVFWAFNPGILSRTRTIAWIADFQHNRLPEFFSEKEIQERTAQFQKTAASAAPLVLSSTAALRDFQTYYSRTKENVYVVPFVSYIEPMIRQVRGREDEILHRLSLDGVRYACVMNQFWQHKNHKVVFEALRILYEQYPDTNLDLVMTGEMSDYRNPEYIDTLKSYTEDPVIRNHIHILGFISREDQIAVMEKAEFVIQPSLFEGWGTVAEDAKVLDKTILLSDIPVHREQQNGKCILFNPDDARELAELIREESEKEHTDNPEAGIRDMYRRAESYSEGFEKLLREAEKGKTAQ